MIVYHVMSFSMYDKMRTSGMCTGNASYVYEPYKVHYEWMMKQLQLNHPSYDGVTPPIWVWQRQPSRNELFLKPPGKKSVILKLEIPEEHILFSCFDAWHFPLSDEPVLLTQEEYEDYTTNEWSTEQIQATWPRIFDLEKMTDPSRERQFPSDWIQGVTPFITMDMVKKVYRFIPKQYPRYMKKK
ncbi:hypothetical protein A374_04074 [Fictibacillus macauensis ZFHKF-1]|uniref:DUF3841 domain-containing protein n=1 Tax=Fictibacillus macauensis ZFHKF-1 TaxID=1196324 RepID=I8AM27_9BACL|nr:DUF3841 domain-containing protein [Fictibacillus macauensis]EIT86719.1 hypothetical protein A374_04074 [Fictibacillus macauensis ZFHKF-1]